MQNANNSQLPQQQVNEITQNIKEMCQKLQSKTLNTLLTM